MDLAPWEVVDAPFGVIINDEELMLDNNQPGPEPFMFFEDMDLEDSLLRNSQDRQPPDMDEIGEDENAGVDLQEGELLLEHDAFDGAGSQEDDVDGKKESEEEGGESLKMNPLLIPNIVEEVLRHVSANDVEKFREVSKSWDKEACTVDRNKRIVVFLEAEAVKVYNNSMRNTSQFPHAHFEFCIPDITGFVDENVTEFWDRFGTHIKAIDFRQSHIFWRDLHTVVENKLPNLEKLTLRHLPRIVTHSPNVVAERQHILPSVKVLRLVSMPSSSPNAVERLTDLLKALPNLESLEIFPIRQATVKSRVSTVILDVLQKPEISLPHLRRININLEVNSDHLDALANKRIPFEKLQITVVEGARALSFRNMISSLRGSLTELKVSLPDSYSNTQAFINQNNSMHPDECIQLLTRLQLLHMKNFKGSINFVQNLTELKSLSVTSPDLTRCIPFGFNGVFARYDQDHTLRRLELISKSMKSCKLAETLVLDSISRCFPFLNCLHIAGIDDDGLGVIYRNLPFLSEAEFLDAKCTDQGLTGIPLEICNDMLETSTFIIVQAEKYRRDLFIGSLQFLRKLTVVAPQISDASIALGLVDCKNMRELKIGSSVITDTGIIFVTDKFHKQLDFLDVSECTDITEQSKFYAREKLRGKLKVLDLSQDGAVIQSTTQAKDCAVIASNPDRKIVMLKARTTFGVSPSSKYATPDLEFFEETADDEARERGAGAFPMFIAHAQFHHPERRARYRNLRIREALRRNPALMRTLQRLGAQQFQRLFRAELNERNQERNGNGDLMPIPDPADLRADVGGGGDINNDDNGQQPRIRLNDEDDDGAPGPAPSGNGNAGPNRLPEIHIAEIYRLGLRLDDIEFFLLNGAQFEREENGNRNPAMRGQPEMELFGMAEVNQALRLGFEVQPADEFMEMEAIRRVFVHAFDGEDEF